MLLTVIRMRCRDDLTQDWQTGREIKATDGGVMLKASTDFSKEARNFDAAKMLSMLVCPLFRDDGH